MKILTKHLKMFVTQATVVFTVMLCCTACGSVFDDEGDCEPRYYMRFVYDMNMLYADAFASKVTSVDLYVFDDESGTYVTHFSDKGEALSTGNYRMPLDLKPGKYKFVAWCGLADNDNDFTVPQSFSKPEDLKCTMARNHDEKGAYSSRNLHALFHGTLSAELADAEGEHVYTIRLTKDTNNINLSLQHTAGPLDPERFEITMTDDNGLMAYDNSLLADEQIEYRPWRLDGGTLNIDGNDNKEAGFLIAEISTARLMADRECRINIVDKQEGKTVFSIPLVQWALILRSANHTNMSEQEYLDREDEYNLMVFLADNGEAWMAMEIVINGWHIINSETEL